jgi:hypothetical protein
MSELKQRLCAWLNLHPDEALKNSLHDLWFGAAIKSPLQRGFGDHHFGMAVEEITRLEAQLTEANRRIDDILEDYAANY